MNDLALDLSNVESVDFDVLPKGVYPIMIENVDVCRTKDNAGAFISIQFVVFDGPLTNRKIFDNFNIDNANPAAVRMGLGRLKDMLTAAGAKSFKISNTDHLVGLSMFAKVTIRSQEGFDDKNNIIKFGSLDENMKSIAASYLTQRNNSNNIGNQQHAYGQGGGIANQLQNNSTGDVPF